VARRLAATRLVVESVDTSGEPAYDLAHAALATHWRRLREWLVEERDFRHWQEDLRDSVRRGEPLRGPRLSHAQRWLREHPDGITGAERAFVETSRQRHRRRTVAWRGGVALIAVLAVLASTSALVLRQRTIELADQVRRNAAHALINEASERVASEPDTATLMTVAAYRASSDPATLAHLAGEYLRFRSTRLLLHSDLTYLREVRLSADGRVVAAIGTGGGVVWRLDDKPTTPWYVDSGLTTIALSQDGGLVAGVDGARQVVVWRPGGAKAILGKVDDPLLGAPSLRFDSGSRLLLVAQPGATPQVWDVQSQAPVAIPKAVPQTGGVWFGPGGKSLVGQESGGALAVWNLADGRKTTLTESAEGRAAVSRDGLKAYTCDGPARVTWDLVALKAHSEAVPGGQCPDLSSSRLDPTGSAILVGDPTDHSGRLLVAGAPLEGDDRHVRARMSLVDPAIGGAAYPVLPPNAGPVLAYDIATGLADGGVRVVSSAGASVAVMDLTPADFARPFASPPLFDPQYLRAAVTSGPPATPKLSIWDTTKDSATPVPLRSGETLERFTADGRRLLTRVGETHLLVRDVLKPNDPRELKLPDGGKASPFQADGGLCVEDTDPDTVAVVFAGFVTRFNLQSGQQTGKVPLSQNEAGLDRERLAGTGICAVRPRHDEIAFNTSQGVEVWNLGQGSLVARLPLNRPTAIASIEFSVDGGRLAVLGQDGTLDVWDVDGQRLVVDSLTVLPAGLLFASIVDFPTSDRIIVRVGGIGLRIWDLDRRAPIANVDVDSDRSLPAVSADGRTLLMWVRSAGVFTMPLEPERWAEHLCRLVGRDLTDAERRTLPAGSPTGEICPPQ
jgi:WD40 repeat protein